jgi:hypothetical protein
LGIASKVVVVGESKGGAAPAVGRIARGFDDGFGLLDALHHGDHHAVAADIEGTGEEVVFAARHAHHGRDADAAAVGDLGLDGFKADAGVLHVVHDVFGAGVGENLRRARRKELEHHGAEHRLARHHTLPQRFLGHVGSS